MRKEIYNLHQLCGVYRLQHLGMKMNWAIQHFVRLVSFQLSFEGRGYTTELTSIAVKVSIDNEQISECKRKLRWSNYCFAVTDRFLNSFFHKKRLRIEFPTLGSFIPLFGEICLQYICYFGSISLLLLLRTLEI